jgi:hypothetical protein
MLWAGRFGTFTQPSQSASQSNLGGVVGGQRTSQLSELTLTNFVNIVSTQQSGQPALSFASGLAPSGRFSLEYGALNALNLNLTADGSLAFELDILGDMDDSVPVRPVRLTITARSGAAPAGTAVVQLGRDGAFQIPFTAFTPALNFADVDYLKFDFDTTAVSGVDYTLIGGLRTTGCLQSGIPIADRFLDAFVAPFPPRNLPGAGLNPILWVGTFNGVSQAVDSAVQSGIPGAIGGQRNTTLTASSLSNFVTAVMTSSNGTPLLGYASSYPTSAGLTLAYGAQAALNANLSAMRAFELEVDGDLYSGPRPVPLTITVRSGSTTRSAVTTLIDNRTYYVPFTSFAGINFADVDAVTFAFDATHVQAVDFDLVGGLRASACIR